MQTLQGIRFLPLARVDGTWFGLDARWFGLRGLGLLLLLVLASPAGPLSSAEAIPWWARAGIGLATVAALVLTTLGHELGHAIVGRLSGIAVRAVVVAPQGGMTIRGACDQPALDFRTALAGPFANAILGTLCLCLAVSVGSDNLMRSVFIYAAALQLITAIANLLPYGPMDGQRILAAWREL